MSNPYAYEVKRSLLLEMGINVAMIAFWSGAILILVPPVVGFALCRKIATTMKNR